MSQSERRICAVSDDPAFVCYRQVLPPHRLEGLLAETIGLEARFEAATITERDHVAVDPRVRSSRILTCMAPSARAALQTILEIVEDAPPVFGDPRPYRFGVDARILQYDDGDFFDLHRDRGRDAGSDRLVSFVYQFFRAPAGFSGGVLRLHGEGVGADPFVDIPAESNLLTVFRPTTPHQVLPVRKTEAEFGAGRFVINGWLTVPS